jgi:hypothetical protein
MNAIEDKRIFYKDGNSSPIIISDFWGDLNACCS